MWTRVVLRLLFCAVLVSFLFEQATVKVQASGFCCQMMGWPCDLQGCLDACSAAGWPDLKCSQCCIAECVGGGPTCQDYRPSL